MPTRSWIVRALKRRGITGFIASIIYNNMKKSQPAGRQGFTLIEILIAVAIIGILTAIGIVSYASVNKRARDAKRFGDIEQIRSALEMYRSDIGYYPAVNTSGFDVAVNLSTELTTTAIYLPSIPTDPQPAAHAYRYMATAQDSLSLNYYGYCLCTYLETQISKSSTCGVVSELPEDCISGVRNP